MGNTVPWKQTASFSSPFRTSHLIYQLFIHRHSRQIHRHLQTCSSTPTSSIAKLLEQPIQRQFTLLLLPNPLCPKCRYVLLFSREWNIPTDQGSFKVYFSSTRSLPLLAHYGHSRILPSLFQPAEVRVDTDPMGLFNVSLRAPLVHIRMQVLQIEDLSPMYEQSLNPSVVFVLELWSFNFVFAVSP